jgi:NAD(P)H dehydrogenase (quinone)
VTHEDLQWADAIAFGSPTRFGNIAAQVKTYIDTLGGLWASNALVGKLASAFTSSNSQHGGQETTIVCGFLPLFLHLGMLVVGLPYTFAGTHSHHRTTPHTTRHTPHTHNTR